MSSSLVIVIEVPVMVLAVLMGIRAFRVHSPGPLRQGLTLLVSGLGVLAAVRLHAQVETHFGIDLFETILGGTGAAFFWAGILAIAWSVAAVGFHQMTAGSMMDALTGVGNRRQFEATLGLTIRRAGRTGTGVGLIMIDIDRFKSFNDAYGHQEGDRCLQAVAACLQETAKRATDIVCRHGGEEFAIVVTHTDPGGLAQLAESLRGAVLDLGIDHAASRFEAITISLGVGYWEPTNRDASPDALVRAADRALIKAKDSGRNQVEFAMVERMRTTVDGSPSA